jgi:hypothetical protein
LDLDRLQRIEVRPEQIELHSSRDQALVLVTGFFSDGVVVDLSRQAHVESSDPAVAEVADGAVHPKGDGACDVNVVVGRLSSKTPLRVAGYEEPAPMSFRTETVAALTRHGCNSGGCHGAPSGKGGFQLSLQAYDLALDERSLTRGEEGRRINSIEPSQSLLLLKPTMYAPHRGGLQLRTTDYAYQVLRQWIAEGARVDEPAGTQCVLLELLPDSGRVLKRPHMKQQIAARAHFDDGTIRDVTRLTRFSSSDDQVATVSEDGMLVGHKRGQVAVMARYLDQLVSCQFTLIEDVPGFQWTEPAADNYVDELVGQQLRELQFAPAEICTDHDFVRRVYLDVIGVLPTLDEQQAFYADAAPDRRQRLIDSLLNRPERARFWALKWGDLLRLQKEEVTETGVYKFYEWLVEAFQTNKPFDQFARELLTAEGSSFDRPAANYFRACNDPVKAAETTAQLFLGSRIQCAKCHNHPFENWTQDNFYGLTAFFNRVSRKPGLRADEEIIFVAREGEVTQPRTGQRMKPWAPGQQSGEAEMPTDRRKAFADWLTSPKNPYFARVAVNRIWAEVMGRGIVDPVDDFRQSNPPSIPALLDRLAEDFVNHGFDQKHILRTILASRAYQRSSQASELNRDDSRFFSHAKMRMMTAEQMLDAVCQVTEVRESFPGLPAGTLATETPSPDFNHAFLDAFGRPARSSACVCERGVHSTLGQVIELFNGTLLQQKLADKQNRFRRLLAEGRPPQEVVDELYRAAVCRPPTEAETAAAVKYIAAQEQPAEGMADVCWALINTDEFLTQH